MDTGLLRRLAATLAAALLLASAATAADAPATIAVFKIDRLEYRAGGGPDGFAWDAQAWIGGDDHKLRLELEGHATVGRGEVEDAEVQILYARRISDFWDAQIGVRHDLRPRPDRTYGVIGLHGLADYFIETEAALFVSETGDVTARLEGEIDVPIIQGLIAQPRIEANFAAQSVPTLAIGAGLVDVELGFRVRYEIRRELAPYVGVVWARKIGETARLARRDGEDADTVSFVVGLKTWF
ncbi:MAG: copper resistance protein B [Alphaproteobacteria bacterium]|nr:copper resistance protein B [Alphaproteobacteria bacterium]